MNFFSYPDVDSNDPLSINAMFEHFDHEDVSNELEELLQCTVTDKLGGDFGLRTPPLATDFTHATSPTNNNIALCGSLNNNNIKINNNNHVSAIGNSNNNNGHVANGFASVLNATTISLADVNNSRTLPAGTSTSIPANTTTITSATNKVLRGVNIAGFLQLTEENRSNVWLADATEQNVPRTTAVSTPALPAVTGVAISELAADSRIRNRNSLSNLASNTNGTIHINGSNPRVFVDHMKETENSNPNLTVNQRTGLPINRHASRDQPVKQCTAVLLGTVGQLSKNGLTAGAQHHSVNSPLQSSIVNHSNNSSGQEPPRHQDETTTATPLSPIFLLQSYPQQTQTQQHQQQRILQDTEQRKHQGMLGNIFLHSQNVLPSNGNIAIQPMETNEYTCKTNKTTRTMDHFQSNLHPTVDTSALADTLTCEDLVRDGHISDKTYPKPVYSYSCLIAMALKNSKGGSLPVSEIYNFMIENFPYFKNAPGGWKNSVRHNLSLNKCFEKVENPKLAGTSRKGCLWALNPAKIPKMEEEIAKWEKKDPQGIRNSMAKPERLEMIVQGRAGSPRISQELANIIVSSTSNQIYHPSTLTTTAGQLDLKSSVLSSLQNQQHLEVMDGGQQQIAPSKIEEMLGVSLKDVNALDTSFTLDPALTELALKGSLWDEDLNVELSVDIPLNVMSTNGNLQTLNTLANSGPHINLYSPLTGIRNDSLTTTGFGHTAYG